MKINPLSLQFANKMIIWGLNPALEVGNLVYKSIKRLFTPKSINESAMKKPILPVLAICFLATLSFFSFKQNQPMSNFMFNDYEKAWEVVDSLERKGLPESALKQVEAIVVRAKKDDNSPQLVKALLYRGKYQSQLTEDGLVNAIHQLEEETKESKFPVTPILQSIQASLYHNYLRQNQWQLRNRTEIVDSKETDIRTWSMRQLLDKTSELYLASVSEERLKEIKIEEFKAITREDANAQKLRPTLFDVLAHRAIDYFSNERNTLNEPAYKFHITQEEAFAPVETFTKTSFDTKDTSSSKYQTLRLLQKVLSVHKKDKDSDALLDADLKRLQFVYQNAILDNKRDLHIQALEKLLEQHKDRPSSTEIQWQLAKVYLQSGQQYQPNAEDAGKWDLKKAYDICQQAIDKFPNSYGAKQCQYLMTGITSKRLELQVEQVNIPNQPILASLLFKNVKQALIRVVRIGYEEDLGRHNEIVDRLKDKPVVLSQVLTLPQEGDYHDHRVEFDLGSLPLGHYAVLVSDNTSFSSKKGAVGYTFFHLSNLAFWSKSNQEGQTELTVIDRTSGEPLEGVIAELYGQEYKSKKRKYEYKKVSTLQSDKDGFVLPSKVNERNFRVKLIKGEDVLYLEDGFSNYRNRRRQGPAQTHTHFFLDRAIYRPGQTVHFKGIVIKKEPDGLPSIEEDLPVTISFKDANHQPVEDLQLTTNEFGTITGTFTAPKTGLLGQMHISSSAGGQQYFSVEEYKRPKFEVTFNPVQGGYKLGDTVAITGKAMAFAGSSIDGSEVKYRVVRQVKFPWIPYWYYRYNPYQKPDMEITSGVTTTNEKGEFEIEFTAIADPSIPADKQPEFTYKIYADVTDITGETQSTETRVSVGYVALSIDLPLAEKINGKEATELKIKSQNLAGEFEPAQGNIIVESLSVPNQAYKKRLWAKPDIYLISQADFNKKFPSFAYQKEDEKQEWKVKDKVEQISFNTTQKKKVLLPKLKPGMYKLTLTTQDKYDTPVKVVKYFEVFDEGKKKLASNSPEWLLHPQKNFEPGETASISIGSALAPIEALVEIEKQGKIVKRYWKKIKGLDQIEIPIKESDRGNFHYHISFAKDNRSYHLTKTILVPWSNKELTIEYATFRDKLLPGQDEEWQIKLSGPKKEKIAAEMVAGMYDASLDQFAVNDWLLNIYPTDAHSRTRWYPRGFAANQTRLMANGWNRDYVELDHRIYPTLNNFGFGYEAYGMFSAGGGRGSRGGRDMAMRSRSMEKQAMPMAAPPAPEMEVAEMAMVSDAVQADGLIAYNENEADSDNSTNKGAPPIRTNLKETVFFLPNLKTDKDGNIIIKFKMNEALTRWRFLGLAHTKDLKFATTQKEIVTQKELMVQPNAPRFFREGDVIEFTAKVSNLSEEAMTGSAEIELLDALTMQPVNKLLGVEKNSLPFTVAAGQSTPLSWKVAIPVGKVNAITHRVIAKAGKYSDGEESALPVLSNRMLVTESKPLAVRGKETKTFTLESLAGKNGSATLQPHQYTLEFTSNPAWYGVQALPYLMEYPYDCTEQIFNRLYANTLASTVANAHPQIQEVFKSWKGKESDALKSNLSKNQELKSALLEETPWVLNAQSEEKQKQNIALLFDLNKMADEQANALAKIKERQLSNGGFAWFPGGRDNWYITQYLVEGMGHLKKLNALDIGAESDLEVVLGNATRYIDARLVEHYAELKKRKKVDLKEDHLSNMAIHYLYARSFFMDIPIAAATREAFDYYVSQSEKYWLNKGVYQEGMIGLALNRINKSAVTSDIIKSLKERSLKNEELGMYWKQPSGYYWHQLPMETHSIMIELFEEVAKDRNVVNELKIWLLKNKQTNHWKTTKATSAVVYALLMSGDNWITNQDLVSVSLGGGKQYASKISDAQSTPEAGTGYFKTSWNGDAITADMASIKVSNPNDQPAWGAVYYQYFEDLDKIKTFEETPLTIKKQLFKEMNSDTGQKLTAITEKNPLTPGDKVKVRIEIRVDRSMEYVHLKDTRAAGFEPINVHSQYKWQGGLGYYESTKDASTNFFISHLPKGTFVFEYPLRVVHKGEFSNGITSMQCMYAPEFSSHSEGIRVTVE